MDRMYYVLVDDSGTTAAANPGAFMVFQSRKDCLEWAKQAQRAGCNPCEIYELDQHRLEKFLELIGSLVANVELVISMLPDARRSRLMSVADAAEAIAAGIDLFDDAIFVEDGQHKISSRLPGPSIN